MKPITIIENNKFDIKCSTKTYIAKTSECMKKSIQELSIILPESYLTKFRNCVIQKINNKSIKLYTNMTVQINGVSNRQDLFDLIKNLDLKITYNIKCVMSNWTIKISDKIIDLIQTMDLLNKNKITAYFLRGYPLIIKYKSHDFPDTFLISYKDEKKIYSLEDKPQIPEEIEVSVLMFKSGNCIVSGKLEKTCTECIQKIKNFIIYKE